jgi:hypothetical protein
MFALKKLFAPESHVYLQANMMFRKRWIWLIALVSLALPAMAQDRGADAGEDLFDLSSLGSLGNVGPDFDPLLEVRNLLFQARVTPMDQKQEKELKKVYDKEVKVVAKPYEDRFRVPLKQTMGALQSPRGRRGANSGRRESPQIAEARRLAGQLVDKVIAALRVDQQGSLRRHQSEQIRIAKWNGLNSSMAQAGTPLSSAQITEAQAILERESRLRTLMIVEARGGPYQSQVAQLEAQTKERLVALLDPPQRIAYAEATSNGNSPAMSRGRPGAGQRQSVR